MDTQAKRLSIVESWGEGLHTHQPHVGAKCRDLLTTGIDLLVGTGTTLFRSANHNAISS